MPAEPALSPTSQPHQQAIAKFIKRLNAAITRSPLLKVSSKTTSKQIDLDRFSCLGNAIPRTLAEASLQGDRLALQFDPSQEIFGRGRDEEAEDGELNPRDRKKRAQRVLMGQLEQMRRTADLAKRETGIHPLWIGFPLVYVPDPSDSGGSGLLAPVFLFPSEIEPSATRQGRVAIAHSADLQPRFNTAMSAWVNRYHGIELEQPTADDLQDLSQEWLDGYLQRLGAQFTPAARWPGLHEFREVPDLKNIEGSQQAQFFAAGVLGIFRWQNESILADLEQIRKLAELPEAVDGLMKGTKRAELPVTPPPEDDRFFVTHADFSQQRVVWKARANAGLVVHGPPGTGKSQTIVNIIADTVARGGTVLMVCQKEAATRVVKSRLDAAGLKNLCIEMHDPDTDRLAVFKEIRDQVGQPIAPPRSAVDHKRSGLSRTIEEIERELDSFAAAMRHTHERCGVTYQHLLGLEGRCMSAFPDARPLPALKGLGKGLTTNTLNHFLDQIDRAGVAFRESRLLENPWRHRRTDITFTPTVSRDVTLVLEAIDKAELAHAEVLNAHRLKFTFPPDLARFRTQFKDVVSAIRQMDQLPTTQRSLANAWLKLHKERGPLSDREREQLAALVSLTHAVERQAPDPAWASVAEGLAELDRRVLLESAKVVAANADVWYRGLIGDFRRARATIRKHRPDALGPALFTVAASAEPHFAAVDAHRRLLESAPTAHPSVRWSGSAVETAVGHVRDTAAALNFVQPVLRLSQEAAWAAPLLDAALASEQPARALGPALKAIKDRLSHVEALLQLIDRLSAWLGPAALGPMRTAVSSGNSISSHVERLRQGLPLLDALRSFDGIAASQDQSIKRTLAALLEYEEQASKGDCHPIHPHLETAADFGGWWRSLAGLAVTEDWRAEIYQQHPILDRLSARDQDELVAQLRRALDEKRKLEAEFIAGRWAPRQEEVRNGPWEAFFKLRGGRRGPAKKLREAVELSIPTGLLNLRPVWLTNPGAAAQVFPLTAGLFDLVIFDEASQCPIEQAIPVVYRGKRVVVSGDEKQLPPTSFFSPDSVGTEDDEEIDAEAEDIPVARAQAAAVAQFVSDAEDLLGAAVASLPHDYLSVHYRSEHPALIEFSNRAFYGGLLEAPPSRMPSGTSNPPISFIEAGGTYLRRVNVEEARKVVESVKDLLLNDPTHPTIGVVTFNQPQRELIQDLLEEEKLADRYFADAYERELNRSEENQDVGLFVKNLENVQGDERDVMVFSTTFGPDESGRFFRRFGPVGQQGGERRLNVAVTRAKRRIVVVSSMPIHEISTALHAGDGTGSGITPPGYLQLYLAYATGVSGGHQPQVAGVLDRLKGRASYASVGEPESILEEEIRDALVRLGYHVDSQIGVGGFRIDLAVRHRDPALGYALGIECDGAAYHSDRSARLRDVWRQDILQKRYGWRMHRVWSTRWWHYKHEEVSKLATAVESALSSATSLR